MPPLAHPLGFGASRIRRSVLAFRTLRTQYVQRNPRSTLLLYVYQRINH